MDLNLYAVCAAIMRHGSVSQAAQSLGLTQPATSNALTRLRRQLGDHLFVRSKNGMLPTKFATDMVPIIDRALGDLQSVTQDHAVSDIVQADLKGNFTFVMSDLEVVLFIIDLVGGLSPAAPGVSIEVRPFRSDILQESLELERVDFVSARMATPMKNLVSRRLLELDFVCVMGSRNGLGCEEVISLDQYIGFRHVLVAPDQGGRRGVIDDHLRTLGRQRSVVCSVPHFLSACLLVSDTDHVVSCRANWRSGRPGIFPCACWNCRLRRKAFPSGCIGSRRGTRIANMPPCSATY